MMAVQQGTLAAPKVKTEGRRLHLTPLPFGAAGLVIGPGLGRVGRAAPGRPAGVRRADAVEVDERKAAEPPSFRESDEAAHGGVVMRRVGGARIQTDPGHRAPVAARPCARERVAIHHVA